MSVTGPAPLSSGLGYLSFIALQYGLQPLLSKSCIHPDTPTSSLVLLTEASKVFGCLAILWNQGSARKVLGSWTVKGCIVAAGLPSVTYVVQNYCIQLAYQNLDGVAFNVLNQSKALFTAFFSFLINGRRQSRWQCLALLLVSLAGVLVSMPQQRPAGGAAGRENASLGVACVLAGSALSGLGSGVTEWALQRQQRDNFLLSLEMAAMGCLIVLANLLLGLTADSEVWWREGLLARWGPLTIVPVLTQGLGGIVVGIITKVAGGVRKVLATISGLILTCVLQQLFYRSLPPLSICCSVPLVVAGIYLHASYPPRRPADAAGKQ